jgi:transposase
MMNKTLYVGCDVSKGYADFLILFADKAPVESAFRLEDTPQGHRQLQAVFEHWAGQGVEQIDVGLESTGGYENNWIREMLSWPDELPLRVARLNPVGPTSIRKAGLARTVTDAVSAEAIARYLITFPDKIRWLKPNHELASARKFQRSTATLLKQRQQLANQLEKLLYEHFPPLMMYTRHGIPRWMITMLSAYPSPQSLRRAGVRRLSKIKGLTAGKAESVLGKLSEASREPGFFDRENIRQTTEQILHLYELIDQRSKLLQGPFADDPQVRLLQSIPGIGLQTAVSLRIEIEDVARFASAKKLAAYFGVCPKFVQSGDKKGQIRMSKQGRPEVRKALYMSSLSAIRHDEVFKRLYHRYRSNGYNHYQAIGVVMHKLLRVVYGVLHHQRAYNPEIDRENRRRAGQKQRAAQQEKVQRQAAQVRNLHRYQPQTESAPRSRRSVQKLREEQSASQSSAVEEYAGSPTAPQHE